MGLCTSSYKKKSPKVYDPIAGSTGGRQQRGQLFNYLDAYYPTMREGGAAITEAARRAAAAPGWNILQNLATRTASGDYLKAPPELEESLARMRASGQREAADTNAAIQSQFARNGLPFSTANQQAQQAAGALATSRANDTEANTRLQHYLSERQNQILSPQMLAAATSGPLEYLSQAQLGPLAALGPIGQLIQQLTTGTPTAATYLEKQPILNQITGGIGSL